MADNANNSAPPAETKPKEPANNPVPVRAPKWRKVHHATLVTLPDGTEKPQGAIFDASAFDKDLLAYYEAEGYLLPSDPPEVQE